MKDRRNSDDSWRDLLTDGIAPGILGRRVKWMRRLYGKLPAEPRCKICNVPFSGRGGKFARVALRSKPSTFSMQLCARCEGFARAEKPGADVDLALVFADIRGSTSLAEQLPAMQFSQLINRFYTASADVLVESEAIIEKLAGDQVAALFVPGLVGTDYVQTAISAAIRLMESYGHGSKDGPWVPVGAGVHVGNAFVGMVGTSGQMTELTSLGDAPNVTARLAGAAAAGEILLSDAAFEAAGNIPKTSAVRDLNLKGRSEPMRVHVIASG